MTLDTQSRITHRLTILIFATVWQAIILLSDISMDDENAFKVVATVVTNCVLVVAVGSALALYYTLCRKAKAQ